HLMVKIGLPQRVFRFGARFRPEAILRIVRPRRSAVATSLKSRAGNIHHHQHRTWRLFVRFHRAGNIHSWNVDGSLGDARGYFMPCSRSTDRAHILVQNLVGAWSRRGSGCCRFLVRASRRLCKGSEAQRHTCHHRRKYLLPICLHFGDLSSRERFASDREEENKLRASQRSHNTSSNCITLEGNKHYTKSRETDIILTCLL